MAVVRQEPAAGGNEDGGGTGGLPRTSLAPAVDQTPEPAADVLTAAVVSYEMQAWTADLQEAVVRTLRDRAVGFGVETDTLVVPYAHAAVVADVIAQATGTRPEGAAEPV